MAFFGSAERLAHAQEVRGTGTACVAGLGLFDFYSRVVVGGWCGVSPAPTAAATACEFIIMVALHPPSALWATASTSVHYSLGMLIGMPAECCCYCRHRYCRRGPARLLLGGGAIRQAGRVANPTTGRAYLRYATALHPTMGRAYLLYATALYPIVDTTFDSFLTGLLFLFAFFYSA